MIDLKSANEMYMIAKAFSEDEAIKTAFTQLQGEIYNEASNGKFYLNPHFANSKAHKIIWGLK